MRWILSSAKLMSIARKRCTADRLGRSQRGASRACARSSMSCMPALDAEQQPDMATAERDTAATLARLEAVAAKLPAMPVAQQ